MIEKHELSALAKSLARVIGESMAKFAVRLHALEQSTEQRFQQIPVARDGKDAIVDYEKIESFIAKSIDEAVKALPPAKDGKDANLDIIQASIGAYVADQFTKIPLPKDGKDGKDAEPVNPETLTLLVRDEVTKAVADIPKPKDGKDANPDLIQMLVTSEVLEAVRALPPPKDGKDGKDIDHESVVADVLKRIPPPKDGQPGKDASPEQIREVVLTELTHVMSEIPKPKDGKDGSCILIGEGPPLSAGKPGDVYLDTKTGDIYRNLEESS